jgi:teichuronic acid biosynthesis glycosyltransferase TuaC
VKVLVFTTAFPNPAQPTHGLFVFERTRHLARHADLRVVAPVTWRVRIRQSVPHHEARAALSVLHPTFYYLPGLFKVFDGLLLFLSSLRTVARLRRDFRFDLIDAHFAFPDGCAAVLLGWWFRCPVTITLRGTLTLLSIYRWRRWAIAWTVRRATRLIAVAAPLADHAVALGAHPSRVEIIPNGVDGNVFSPMPKAEARAQLGLPAEGRFLVSVGHLSARKGFQRVMAVLPRLASEYPDLSFAIIGGAGVERNNARDLRRRARAASLQDRVTFVGAQPPEVVRIWLNAADVFVLASDHEGCPNVVWEALACGVPVVATKVGDIGRMVPSFGGLLVDNPDDATALERCLRIALKANWDKEAIRSYAAQHTWERVAERVLIQWREATRAGRRSAVITPVSA